MRQAIHVKIMPTAFPGGVRLKAKAHAGTMIVPWDNNLDSEANVIAARDQLCAKLGWTAEAGYRWVGARLPDGSYAFVESDVPTATTYSRSEIVNGTGFEPGVRFRVVNEG